MLEASCGFRLIRSLGPCHRATIQSRQRAFALATPRATALSRRASSSLRRYAGYPACVIAPSFSLPPLEFCLRVSPSQAAKSRPDLNTAPVRVRSRRSASWRRSCRRPGSPSSNLLLRLLCACVCAISLSSAIDRGVAIASSCCTSNLFTAALRRISGKRRVLSWLFPSVLSSWPTPWHRRRHNSARCPRSALTLISRQAEGLTGNPEPIQKLVLLWIPDRALRARRE